ncbi:MAG: hypothetical protein HFJ17_03545 [Clostridia bacterium]|nr:hypothetical protein [Clostridia bacterium]
MIIDVFGQEVEGRTWVNTQRKKLMKNYIGMSIEEVETDKEMPKRHKERMIALLKLNVSYPKTFVEELEEELELFREYINKSEERKEKFEKTGKINPNATLEKDEEIIDIGSLCTKERNFMARYRGMTIEEIEQDKNIPVNHKIRMNMLLEFGFSYPEEKTEKRNEIECELKRSMENYTDIDEKLNLAKALEEKYQVYTHETSEGVRTNE